MGKKRSGTRMGDFVTKKIRGWGMERRKAKKTGASWNSKEVLGAPCCFDGSLSTQPSEWGVIKKKKTKIKTSEAQRGVYIQTREFS